MFVGQRTYELWQVGPWGLPNPAVAKAKGSSVAKEQKKEPPKPLVVSTKNIIEKNLFDPERGASQTKEAETSSIAMQRIRSMVLMGTAVLGNSSYAILLQLSDPRSPATKTQASQQGQLRVKVGDTVEGFKVSEIHDKRVVFTKGASTVEVSLDFLRKFDDAQEKAKAPAPTKPGVATKAPSPRVGGVPAPPVSP